MPQIHGREKTSLLWGLVIVLSISTPGWATAFLKGSHLLWQGDEAGILHLVSLPRSLQAPLLPGQQEPEGLVAPGTISDT